ncbi:hypothetical protein OQZ33_07135 [Pedobacter sp. MC2016-05]|uniref:hypothetical protein n=1 Tax=Pedobacter sp. MC2016-05 TaxID=2994474 RepID=UPI0022455AE2|nr:hypothetical protein [Pedobacter sp. MC2016-05]MCX2474099.1 hypothetical protein [Pedobacter sp. MC2016-05]
MIIKGRRFILKDSVIIPEPEENKIVLRIGLNATTTPSLAFADMKYNKQAGIMLVSDDGYASDFDIYKFLEGGLVDKYGNTHTGIRGTDGCGNPLNWRMTWALTSAPRDVEKASDRTLWSEYADTIAAGYGYSNHTHDHTGYDKYYQLKQNEKYIFEKTGYRTRTMVIPTADAGYSDTAPNVGYLMVGSQFGLDSPDDYADLVIFNGRIDVKTINQTRLDRFLMGRNFYVTFNNDDTMGIRNALINPTLDGSSSSGSKFMGMIGMHGAADGDFTIFQREMNYIKNHPNGGDKLWMPSMQEFVEYYETKLDVVKTEKIEGNTLVVELDLSTLDTAGLNRDMSFLLNGATITGIEYAGADNVTYNSTTGLINVFKKNQSVRNPYLDTPPPQIIEATRNGNKVNLLYDRPITQSQFSNAKGAAYSVSGNTVLSVTGSGIDWTINCSIPVAVGSEFSYKMGRGNAKGVDGMLVCSYLGFPVG